MRRTCLALLFAASVLAVPTGALARDHASSQTASAQKAPFDRTFIDAMVPHHRSAIAMAKEAKRLGLSEPILISIANDIIRSQAAEIAQMLAWRKAWYGSSRVDPKGGDELGLSMEAMGMKHKASELRKAKNINKAFANMMIPHHRGAITMAGLALERGIHSQLKALARRIIADQKREIRLMTPFASGSHQH